MCWRTAPPGPSVITPSREHTDMALILGFIARKLWERKRRPVIVITRLR